MTTDIDRAYEDMTTLLIASTFLTSTEAMHEARRIVDAARADGYRQGYHDATNITHPPIDGIHEFENDCQ